MPNGLRNWTYRHLTAFLKERGFVLEREKIGSHELWFKREAGEDYTVNVNWTTGSYPQRTLETMIRQSGIDKRVWRNWQGK